MAVLSSVLTFAVGCKDLTSILLHFMFLLATSLNMSVGRSVGFVYYYRAASTAIDKGVDYCPSCKPGQTISCFSQWGYEPSIANCHVVWILHLRSYRTICCSVVLSVCLFTYARSFLTCYCISSNLRMLCRHFTLPSWKYTYCYSKVFAGI